MSFPETRHSLIQRIVTDSAEEDWRQLLEDYWRPVCLFAIRWGKLNVDDAEDVASITFEAILRNRLLSRWIDNRQSKLRTLLCSVTRNVLSNIARVREARKRRVRDHGGALDHVVAASLNDLANPTDDQADPFLVAWAEDMLQRCVESLLHDYHSEGRGDYFRVLYGKICEQMSNSEIAQNLGCKITDVENYYKHAKKRLETTLKNLVRQHTLRYCSPEEANAEFELEWQRFGECLKANGGLEKLLNASYESFHSEEIKRRESQSMTLILNQVRQFRDESHSSDSD
ncbi:MAG: sigma-70 family RNA polymerase sigma factor [Planctomycetes bacterium]|nr:sigma-70 family RNA polymerase sigma factor [Planctomycetota bacterium]